MHIVNINDEYWRYVSLCTHIDEVNTELVKASNMRLTWLKEKVKAEEIIIKVAINDDGKALGFIHVVPIKSVLSQMIGRELMVIPCLTINYQLIYNQVHGTGVGRLLVQSCEDEAKQRGQADRARMV